MIYLENKFLRVEEFYPGTRFTCKDLRDKQVVEKCSRLICDFNYNAELLEI